MLGTEQKYITISVLNEYIREMFESNTFLRKVYLKGEISNFKQHTTGHLYFTLKDENARMSAVMFRSNAQGLGFKPEDGMNVLVTGRISCYPAQGTYQIYVDSMEMDGLGNLFIEYEKLKKKLASEGLFDQKYKKPIPKYPKKIGIITASTGAAIHDILSTIKRRYPICETILFPSLVQGASAAPEIVKQIKKANEFDLDVLICGRGGGSIEDLWAFNEEIVARAIFESKIPIISAVGHDVDYTIADFVADLRAPTPTGAAEMAVPKKEDLYRLLKEKQKQLNSHIKNHLQQRMEKVHTLQSSYILKNPMSLYEIKAQKLDSYNEQLQKEMHYIIENARNAFLRVKQNPILIKPLVSFSNVESTLEKDTLKLKNYILSVLEKKEHEKSILLNKLQLLNPLSVLDKGYSLVSKNNKIIKDIKEVALEDEIEIQLSKGTLSAIVKEKKEWKN